MAGLLPNFDDEPRGLLGGLRNTMMDPMFLAGAGLLTGQGFGGAMRGAQLGMSFQDQQRQEAERRRKQQGFESLLGQINAPPDVLALARFQGPEAATETIGQWVGPAQEARRLEMELKRAQIAKAQREAAENAARQKALYDAFFGDGGAQPTSQPAPAEIPGSSAPVSDGAGRFAAPALATSGEPAPPQRPRDILNALPPNKKAQAQIAFMAGDMETFGKIIGEGPPQIADNLTPGEKRVDQTFAKSYEDFVLSGGAADFEKNLEQLRGVQRELQSGKKNLTGPVLGRMPDAVTSFSHPEAVDARQRVEEVVQRNLRIILGAQFTQKEGENLIARAYNPALDEATNAKRLARLISSMEKMKDAKLKAMDYFERHGTMKGFKGTTQFSVGDLLADLDGPEQRATSSAPQGGWSIRRVD
jgi:hypothetical protein